MAVYSERRVEERRTIGALLRLNIKSKRYGRSYVVRENKE